MEALVSNEVLTSLSQILANLIQGQDNALRAEAERLLTDRWLVTQPESVILALAQILSQADSAEMRDFSAVLLRRFIGRPVSVDPHNMNQAAAPSTIYDHLSEDTRLRTERTLLRSLGSNEVSDSVRKKVVDTVTKMAELSMERGRPWPDLQSVAFECSQSSSASQRDSAFRIFATVPQLVLDQDVQAVLRVLQGGLKDTQSIDVQHSALRASSAYLSSADPATQVQAAGLMHPMLETLPPLNHVQLAHFLQTFIPLSSSHPVLFSPHLSSLLTFLIPLILAPLPSSMTDMSEATPTVGNPNPHPFSHHGASAFTPHVPSTPTASNPHSGTNPQPRFTFPPARAHAHVNRTVPSAEDDARDDMRRMALELLVSLSEARPSMVKACHGWVNGVVRCCLEGMSELRDEGGEATARWAESEDPSEDDDDYGYPHVFEESLDRMALAVGGRALLPVAFQYIPALLASHDWMQRHAGLLAIAAIGEGTHDVMEKDLGKVVALVTPMFKDPHPRVRYAACQCIGQLCTDLEEIIQNEYHKEIFLALIPTLQAPEPRVHSHAAAAIINFCTGVDGPTLQPYLDAIVQGLLGMLNANSKRYVQEQAITTLAMVADAAAAEFRKYYPAIMPNLINVLRTAVDPEMRALRCKVMECASLIAVAVGKDVFQTDAQEFADILLQIQNGVTESDELTPQYLMSTWAKVCQSLGALFEPYLEYVMPPALKSAAVKADLEILDPDAERPERDGYEQIRLQGQRVEIRTASLEEKCTAFDVLLIYCTVMQRKFSPYLSQTLGLALPALEFYYHDGVREAAAMLIPVLVSCAKNSEMIDHNFTTYVFTPIIALIQRETDAGFLASLYKCFYDSYLTISNSAGIEVDPALIDGFLKVTESQLHAMAQRRKGRADKVNGRDWEDEKEDVMLLEEMEGFALEEMQKAISQLDPDHPLLVAVGSVKSMQMVVDYDADEEEEDM